jgi:hypothetical protein
MGRKERPGLRGHDSQLKELNFSRVVGCKVNAENSEACIVGNFERI